MDLRRLYHNLRRWTLRTVVPQWYWPPSVVVDGATIRIRDTPYSFAVRRLLTRGGYEWSERELIADVVTAGMHVIELGGSIGIIAAVVAHRVGPTGKVVTVEASPEHSGFARTWLEAGKPVRVVTGYAFPVWTLPPGLRVDDFSGSEVSLGGTVDFSYGGDPSPGSPRSPAPAVPTYDLSTLCRDHDLTPQLLIADIEASERVLLDHPADYPPTLKWLIFELHPWMYANGEADQQRIIDVLARDGFAVRRRSGFNWLFERTAA